MGKNHSAKGAAVALGIATRLGLAPADARRVEFLVREHLTMGHISQRRDLEDPGLIAHFAQLCGDEETLRELFLITFADLYLRRSRATSPAGRTSCCATCSSGRGSTCAAAPIC